MMLQSEADDGAFQLVHGSSHAHRVVSCPAGQTVLCFVSGIPT